MRLFQAAVCLSVALLGAPGPLAAGMPAFAPHGAAAPLALQLVQAGDRVPLARVLAAIAARFPGRALDAKQVERGGRVTYRIKWLGEDGKVRVVVADATTGDILRVQ